MTNAKPALATLLARAEGADPAHRIDLRDDIAAHGTAAIEAVTPWLKVPALAAFAIRVIARAGLAGNREAAQAALRQGRRRLDARLRADIDWALTSLKASPPPPSLAATAARSLPGRVGSPRTSASSRSVGGRSRTSFGAP
jgi:hypothetical protein